MTHGILISLGVFIALVKGEGENVDMENSPYFSGNFILSVICLQYVATCPRGS